MKYDLLILIEFILIYLCDGNPVYSLFLIVAISSCNVLTDLMLSVFGVRSDHEVRSRSSG